MPNRANTVGDLVRAAREAAAMTQREVAEAAGLSVRALSNLECGYVALPRVHTLRAVARALGYDGESLRDFVVNIRTASGHQQPAGRAETDKAQNLSKC